MSTPHIVPEKLQEHPDLPQGYTKGNSTYLDRVILTTYPGQAGVHPLPLVWGALNSRERGPVLASRLVCTSDVIGVHSDGKFEKEGGDKVINNLKQRNAIGAYGGSYSVYRAVAIAIGALESKQSSRDKESSKDSSLSPYKATKAYPKPDYTNTEPAEKIGPHESWSKIVSIDPFGHLVQQEFKELLGQGYDIRPTIAVTKAHMRIPEFPRGSLKVDGTIVLNDEGEVCVTKAAVDPVWYLKGVAEKFEVEEDRLRRVLFEETGGMFPELVTRPDLQIYLPPIGGASVYVFGPLGRLADTSKELTVRVHDECNGSDVFGTDICTCRPYLIYGIKLAIETAQRGGAGLIVYFRKEGRALGEVTKYLVYNARKRQEGGDRASTYFARTESVAGVRDMRFQSLMPDLLHWLGVKKIDRLVSMSNMKYDAIIKAGIEVRERVAIPKEWIPEDSAVEIEAKIAEGYFTELGGIKTRETLDAVKGRTWDDLHH